MSDHTIKIENGHIQFVYDDALGDLLAEGTVAVCRVSDVEPDARGGWSADMTKAGAPGVLLGPFPTRAEALRAEREWLAENRGL
jgi:hypothetical protein